MNQCDGCRLGLAIENGNHVWPVAPRGLWTRTHMGCTKERYVKNDENKKQDQKREERILCPGRGQA